MDNPLWQPSASMEALRLRAQLLQQIRTFFAKQKVLEVETPQLARHGVTDPYMPLIATKSPILEENHDWYLQSSPEYAMKRLLAAGSGCIYQICKAYRSREFGKQHNPEFTMLEWYRCDFDEQKLIEEIELLLLTLFNATSIKKSYLEVFQEHLNINPHSISCEALEQIAHENISVIMSSDNKNDWLNILMLDYIEPRLPYDTPCFIYDFPEEQAALAKIKPCNKSNSKVAKRFELYWKGLELANGYHELSDAEELKQRLEKESQQFNSHAQNQQQPDPFLLAAQQAGLPECAGVALGLDRLIMAATDAKTISQVLSFPADRA